MKAKFFYFYFQTVLAITSNDVEKYLPSDAWLCKNGSAIPRKYLCDNSHDCKNGEDEAANICGKILLILFTKRQASALELRRRKMINSLIATQVLQVLGKKLEVNCKII